MTPSDLRVFRARHRLTQRELADILGWRHTATVVDFELGRGTLSGADAAKLYRWEAEKLAQEVEA